MKLFTDLNEEMENIIEATDSGEKSFYIKGVFIQGAIKNRNGRVYPMEVLNKEVKRYNKEFVNRNRAFGELGHPSGPTINMERVSHMITSLKREGNNYIGKAKILDTPFGNIVKSLMKEGATLGVSTRGVGSLKEVNGVQEVQDDFHLATAGDIVADPSAPAAFVQGVMENKEWMIVEGCITEMDIDQIKRDIHESSKDELEYNTMKAFKGFMDKISRG